ncbi:helix-turn-helix transcriptional regulator [Streptomyces sp. NBC_01476]|uniref:helix-turn-helix transcriptional regulator n=1 Tax=Streptomyces sp. NBC_01476 TaxID=2903881 RepID=UPI002E34689B|nr:helix-turn-helix transcriptional regulator [Streptomyces sp. NBC_01476]
MTERPFEALGLSADADRAYPLLIGTRGITAEELARQLAVSPERAEAACGELAARDLVRLGHDGRWYPLPPESGLLPLVSRAQEQLRQGRELLDRLGVEYQRVHEGHRAEEIVQVVEGPAAVRRRIASVYADTHTELAVFARPHGKAGDASPGHLPWAGVGTSADIGGGAGAGTGAGVGTGAGPSAGPGPGPGTSPGPRRRIVVERAGFEALGDAGLTVTPATRIRVAEHVPVRMWIADRALALLPLAAAAPPPDPVLLVIRPSGLLDALVTLFESLWATGVPVARPDPEHPRIALHLRILAMLVSGSTDAAMARSLGVAVRTVQRHIAAMQRTAGVDNRIQLVWHAARHNWLDDAPPVAPEI